MTKRSTTQPTVDEALLERLGLGCGHCIVVGLQWGDEGKGKVVDLLAPQYDVVVRYNGGANAGHSVHVGNERYALHLIPSGILYPDKLNVLGNGVVVDPAALLAEIRGLRERSVTIDEGFRVSNRAHVVFPYHKLLDSLLEVAAGAARGDDQKIGTTGRGIGPCYADKALRTTAIRMGDLLDPDRLTAKLRLIVTIKNPQLAALAQQFDRPFQPFDAQQLAQEYAQYGRDLRPHICDTTELLHDAMDAGKQLLFEGANATLLDIDHGTYPFVTSSNCSSLGAATGTGVPGSKISHVLGVVKAYATRVGGGPMPTELRDATGDRIRESGHEYGTTTGRPRRCGWLDLAALNYTAKVSGATGICLMRLDVLAGIDHLRVCVGYRLGDRRLTGFPSDADTLAQVEPIYQDARGFQDPISDCRQFAELPAAARDYVKLIEEHVGVPISMISVGPRRDQTIPRS